MKIFLQTLAVAFGMFSAVPLPQPVWNRICAMRCARFRQWGW